MSLNCFSRTAAALFAPDAERFLEPQRRYQLSLLGEFPSQMFFAVSSLEFGQLKVEEREWNRCLRVCPSLSLTLWVPPFSAKSVICDVKSWWGFSARGSNAKKGEGGGSSLLQLPTAWWWWWLTPRFLPEPKGLFAHMAFPTPALWRLSTYALLISSAGFFFSAVGERSPDGTPSPHKNRPQKISNFPFCDTPRLWGGSTQRIIWGISRMLKTVWTRKPSSLTHSPCPFHRVRKQSDDHQEFSELCNSWNSPNEALLLFSKKISGNLNPLDKHHFLT